MVNQKTGSLHVAICSSLLVPCNMLMRLGAFFFPLCSGIQETQLLLHSVQKIKVPLSGVIGRKKNLYSAAYPLPSGVIPCIPVETSYMRTSYMKQIDLFDL